MRKQLIAILLAAYITVAETPYGSHHNNETLFSGFAKDDKGNTGVVSVVSRRYGGYKLLRQWIERDDCNRPRTAETDIVPHRMKVYDSVLKKSKLTKYAQMDSTWWERRRGWMLTVIPHKENLRSSILRIYTNAKRKFRIEADSWRSFDTGDERKLEQSTGALSSSFTIDPQSFIDIVGTDQELSCAEWVEKAMLHLEQNMMHRMDAELIEDQIRMKTIQYPYWHCPHTVALLLSTPSSLYEETLVGWSPIPSKELRLVNSVFGGGGETA